MSEKGCFCSMLECSDGTFYTSWMTNPTGILKQHNCGTGARHICACRPVRMVYVAQVSGRSAAMRREAARKRMHRVQKIRLIDI